jgi:hypothetical protein
MGMTDKDIEDEARASYAQFVSSQPHESSYLSGFVVGAMHARSWAIDLVSEAQSGWSGALQQRDAHRREISDLAARLAAAEERERRLRRGIDQAIGFIDFGWHHDARKELVDALATPAASNRQAPLDSSPAPAPLAWTTEPPKVAGLYTRRLGEAYATHRLDSENVAYASHWYPADAWFGPLPEPAEPREEQAPACEDRGGEKT